MKLKAIKGILLSGGMLLLTLAMQTVTFADNYLAPYMYLTGIYKFDGWKAYPPASDEEVAWLTRQIACEDPKIRAIAAGALAQSGDKRATEPLIKALTDEDPYVKMNAAAAFVMIKEPSAIKPLISLATSKDEEDMLAQMFSRSALAAQGDPGIQALLELPPTYYSQELSSIERAQSLAGVMCESKGADAIGWAIAKLTDKDPAMQLLGLTILKEIGDGYSLANGKQLVRTAITETATVKTLMNAVTSSNKDIRNTAVELILTIEDKMLLDRLIKAARDKTRSNYPSLKNLLSQYQRRLARLGVSLDEAETSNSASISSLVKKIQQVKNTDVNMSGMYAAESDALRAARALAYSKNPEAVKAIVTLMQNKKPTVAYLAEHVIRDAENPLATAPLLKLAKSSTPTRKPKDNASMRAAFLLFELKSKSLIPFYAGLLNNPSVVSYAIQALAATGGNDAIKHILPFLKKAQYRHTAMQALAALHEPAAADFAIQMLLSKNPADRKLSDAAEAALISIGSSAIDKIVPKLQGADSQAKISMIYILQQINNPAATSALASLLNDKNAEIRLMVAQLFADKGDAKLAILLAVKLKDSDAKMRLAAAQALARHPIPDHANALALLLNDKNVNTRACAGIALAQLGDKRGNDAVLSVLTSESENYSDIPDQEMNPDWLDEEVKEMLVLPAIRAAGVLKEKKAVNTILASLRYDVSMSSLHGKDPKDQINPRDIKIEALKSITGQDFGYAFYRWMAYWIAQGNDFQLDLGY